MLTMDKTNNSLTESLDKTNVTDNVLTELLDKKIDETGERDEYKDYIDLLRSVYQYTCKHSNNRFIRGVMLDMFEGIPIDSACESMNVSFEGRATAVCSILSLTASNNIIIKHQGYYLIFSSLNEFNAFTKEHKEDSYTQFVDVNSNQKLSFIMRNIEQLMGRVCSYFTNEHNCKREHIIVSEFNNEIYVTITNIHGTYDSNKLILENFIHIERIPDESVAFYPIVRIPFSDIRWALYRLIPGVHMKPINIADGEFI